LWDSTTDFLPHLLRPNLLYCTLFSPTTESISK
jgi:hypothetical protein